MRNSPRHDLRTQSPEAWSSSVASQQAWCSGNPDPEAANQETRTSGEAQHSVTPTAAGDRQDISTLVYQAAIEITHGHAVNPTAISCTPISGPPIAPNPAALSF